MRWSIAFFSSPRQYAPATDRILKWRIAFVLGVWPPRHRSVNVPWV